MDSTINSEEVKKFDEISKNWWDENGQEFGILHKINPSRLMYILRLIAQHVLHQDHDDTKISSCEKNIEVKRSPKWYDWVLSEEKLSRKDGPYMPKDIGTTGLGDLSKSRSIAEIRILDIGGGGGLISVPLAKFGAGTVHMLDASSGAVEVAKTKAEKLGLSNFQAFCCSVENFEQNRYKYSISDSKDLLYDVVLALEIIEHVEDLQVFIKAALDLVSPGGIFILSSINRTIKSYLSAIVGAEYVLGWVPIGTHEWAKFRKPSEIMRLIMDNTGKYVSPNSAHGDSTYGGISHDVSSAYLLNISSMNYDLLADEWTISSSKQTKAKSNDVNYFMCFRKKSML